MSQSSHEGDCPPFSLRNVADQSLATRAPAPEADHIGSDRGLIDKDQSRRIKKALLPNPAPTRARHVGAVLLGQAFLRNVHRRSWLEHKAEGLGAPTQVADDPRTR
jgi:hypothetical protein